MEDCSIDAKRLSIADVFPIDSSFSRSLFDQHGESPKSAEQEGSKKFQRYNSRKSLGWDSEFLNSPGVLEPDELTSMIESAEKTEKSAVPKNEERQKSNDPKSALVSESLKTANLQDGSSEDTRASVQRSGKASRVENSSGKARSVVPDSHTNQSPKKKEGKELASHGKLKPKPSSMKLSAGTPKSGKTANPLTIHPRVLQLRNNYSGGQSDSSSSEPPRHDETHSPVVSSKKRNSRAEKKNAESAAGKRASSSKIHQSSVSQSMILPGPSSSRSASSPAAAKKAMNSSVDSFASASSSSTIKSAAVITEPTKSTYASVLKKPAPPRTSTATSIGVRSSKSTSSIPTTTQRSKGTSASTSKQSNDGKMLSGQKTQLAAPSTQNGRSASLGRGTNSAKPSSASQFQPQMHRSSSTMSPASSSPDGSISSTSSLSTTKPRSSSSATLRMGQSHQREAAPGSLKSPKPSNDQPQMHRSSSARLSNNSTISPASSSPDRSVRSTPSLSTTKPRSSSATMHRSSSARLSASTLSPASLSPDQSISSTSSLSTTKTRSSSATLRMGQSYQREAAPGPLKSPKPSNNQQLDGQKTKMSARPAQHGRSASTGRLVVKPSALHTPSPKIGSSDGVKSGRTPKGTKQPPNVVPGGLPKPGAKTADANESSINKLKFGSVPSPRSTPKIGSKKAENNKQSRSPQEPSSSAEKVSSRLSQPKIQDPKSGKRNANKEGVSISRDKESRPSEVQTVKNHSVGGEENPAAKPELASSNELVKTVDSSQKVSQISSPEVSSSTLPAKADQSTDGGRMPSEMPTVKKHSIGVKVDENPASKLELASNESVKTQKVSETSSPEVSSSKLSAKADQSTGGGRMPSEMQTVKNQSIGVKVGGENLDSKLELASNESAKTVDSSQKVSETSTPQISSSTLSAKTNQSTGGGKMPSETQTVKNHSIGVKVGAENPASKLELASNESAKTQKVSETSSPKVSSSTLSAKTNQSTCGGRMPSDMQTVKNQSIGVKVGAENPASKLELAASNESVKKVDSSQKVSSSEVSSSALPGKADQSTGGGRMPFSAIHCNKDGSSDGLTGLTQVEKKITISSSPENALDHLESSR